MFLQLTDGCLLCACDQIFISTGWGSIIGVLQILRNYRRSARPSGLHLKVPYENGHTVYVFIYQAKVYFQQRMIYGFQLILNAVLSLTRKFN